jgi:hypothetical protein
MERYWIKWQRYCWEKDGFSHTRCFATNCLQNSVICLCRFPNPRVGFIQFPLISLYICPLKYHVSHVHILLHSSTIIYIHHTPSRVHIFLAKFPMAKYSSLLAPHLFFYYTSKRPSANQITIKGGKDINTLKLAFTSVLHPPWLKVE